MDTLAYFSQSPFKTVFERLVGNIFQDCDFQNLIKGSINNLQINSQGLNEILKNNHFKIIRGNIGEFSLQVPWIRILTENSIIQTKNIYLEMEVNTNNFGLIQINKPNEEQQKQRNFQNLIEKILSLIIIKFKNITLQINIGNKLPAIIIKIEQAEVKNIPNVIVTVDKIQTYFKFNENDEFDQNNQIIEIPSISINDNFEVDIPSLEAQINPFQFKLLRVLIQNLINFNDFKNYQFEILENKAQNKKLIDKLFESFQNVQIDDEQIQEAAQQIEEKKLQRLYIGKINIVVYEDGQYNQAHQYRKYWGSSDRNGDNYELCIKSIQLNNQNDKMKIEIQNIELYQSQFIIQQKDDDDDELFQSLNDNSESFLQQQKISQTYQNYKDVNIIEKIIKKEIINIPSIIIGDEIDIQKVNLNFDLKIIDQILNIQFQSNWNFIFNSSIENIEQDQFASFVSLASSQFASLNQSFTQINNCIINYKFVQKQQNFKININNLVCQFEQFKLNISNIKYKDLNNIKISNISLNDDLIQISNVKFGQFTFEKSNNTLINLFIKQCENSEQKTHLDIQQISINLDQDLKWSNLQEIINYFQNFNEILKLRQNLLDTKFDKLKILQIQPEQENKQSQSISFNIQNIKTKLQTIIFQFNDFQFLKFNNDFMACINNLSIIQENISEITIGSPLPLIQNQYLPEQFLVLLKSQNSLTNVDKQVLASNQNNVFILFKNNKFQISLKNLIIQIDFQMEILRVLQEFTSQFNFQQKKQQENKQQFDVTIQNLIIDFQPFFENLDLENNPQILQFDQTIELKNLRSGNFYHNSRSILFINQIDIKQEFINIKEIQLYFKQYPMHKQERNQSVQYKQGLVEIINLEKVCIIENKDIQFGNVYIGCCSDSLEYFKTHLYVAINTFKKFNQKDEEKIQNIIQEIQNQVFNIRNYIYDDYFQQSDQIYDNQLTYLVIDQKEFCQLNLENAKTININFQQINFNLFQGQDFCPQGNQDNIQKRIREQQIQLKFENIKFKFIDIKQQEIVGFKFYIENLSISDYLKDQKREQILEKMDNFDENEILQIEIYSFQSQEIQGKFKICPLKLFINLKNQQFLIDFFKPKNQISTKKGDFESQKNHLSSDKSHSLDKDRQDSIFVRLFKINKFYVEINFELGLNTQIEDLSFSFSEIYFIGDSLKQLMDHMQFIYLNDFRSQFTQNLTKLPVIHTISNILSDIKNIISQPLDALHNGDSAFFAFGVAIKQLLKTISSEGLTFSDFLYRILGFSAQKIQRAIKS